MPRPSRCASCPFARNPSPQHHDGQLHLFENASVYDAASSPQAQRLREAIAPYLCLNELRRLAAGGENLQTILRHAEPVPDEVQALLTLLTTLLKPRPNEAIGKAGDLAAMLMLDMGDLDHEEFWVICLDIKNHVQHIQRLYTGTLTSSAVRVSEVFRLPLRLNSAAIIVAHCHPSGSTTPSPEDLAVTTLLVQAGKLLDIAVLDHLIIAKGRWLSLREQRLDNW